MNTNQLTVGFLLAEAVMSVTKIAGAIEEDPDLRKPADYRAEINALIDALPDTPAAAAVLCAISNLLECAPRMQGGSLSLGVRP